MITYIAFLRGINVGGHKKVPMVELRNLLTQLGLKNVQSYIQSGNVIFQSSNKNLENLEKNIQKSILNHFGFEVHILIRTPLVLESILNNCPFSEEKKTNSYFIILKQPPEATLIEAIAKQNFPNEEFIITENCVYIYYSLGAGKAKLGVNWFEKKLKVIATARNYKTMIKLQALSRE
ncbi:DUF1697 domain-containing protein [Winogradskyella bathintestinalis]|uniref:DUF1697 domain-containing protein n=1 Tax=Winogradskyella bathintestinalis TaxID=3035208 RepID=A0ABT7ZQG1_9FLAO|nr:DUF1697 domain-containing protein [Winogradskyella bathintestinalis]MDN3491203.1 DUF1697 domain-containing protein [Winogradskyella bathintestinalis]